MTHRTPAILALLALLYGGVHLLTEWQSGGIQSHHLLNQPDLPAISNWWELLVLPALGWALGARVQTHVQAPDRADFERRVGAGLAGALLYGLVLAAAFKLGHADVASGLFAGLLVLAVLLPVYRVEYLLGFAMGMTFAIGAVLPALIGGVLALLSWVVRSTGAAAWRVLRRRANA